MNAFVAIFHRSQKHIDHHQPDRFHRYLPIEPKESHSYSTPNRKIQIFSYVVGEQYGYPSLVRVADSACAAIDGILLPLNEEYDQLATESLIQKLSEEQFDQAIGEYSLVFSKGEELFATSNIGGSHSLYIAETEDLVAISNRSVCLLGVAGISHSLEENGILWKAYQGYIASPYTAFADIRKIRNGSKVTISPNGTLTIQQSTFADLVRPRPSNSTNFQDNPQGAFENITNFLSTYLKRADAQVQAPFIDLPLSGGKDSRVILSLLLNAGLQDRIQCIWTRGTLYSPEVLAAQDLCKTMGFSDRHEVRRPPYFAAANVSAGMIVRTLNNHEGLLSLYDFAGIAPRKSLRAQGHQSIYRRGRFPNCRLDSYENFLEDALKTYHNPLKIVRDTPKLECEMNAFFREQLAAGAPVEDLGDLWRLFERLPSWAAVLSNTDYCSGPMTNPIIMGEFCRFAFSIPHRFRRSEIFHFLSLYFNAPELLPCPFAEVTWPENIREILGEIGISHKSPFPTPYKTQPSFPNLKSPWIPNVKLEYFNALKPFALDVLQRKKSSFSSLLDVDRFITFLQQTESPSFLELYPAMGMYSAAILQEYGSELFDRSRQNDIEADLRSRMDLASTPAAGTSHSDLNQNKEIWESMLTKHEQSIAELTREL